MPAEPSVPGSSGDSQAEPASVQSGEPGAHGINVQQLADKVYSLLLADMRLGWARGEAPTRPRRKGEG